MQKTNRNMTANNNYNYNKNYNYKCLRVLKIYNGKNKHYTINNNNNNRHKLLFFGAPPNILLHVAHHGFYNLASPNNTLNNEGDSGSVLHKSSGFLFSESIRVGDRHYYRLKELGTLHNPNNNKNVPVTWRVLLTLVDTGLYRYNTVEDINLKHRQNQTKTLKDFLNYEPENSKGGINPKDYATEQNLKFNKKYDSKESTVVLKTPRNKKHNRLANVGGVNDSDVNGKNIDLEYLCPVSAPERYVPCYLIEYTAFLEE